MYIVQYVYRLKREEQKFTADIQYGVIGFFDLVWGISYKLK